MRRIFVSEGIIFGGHNIRNFTSCVLIIIIIIIIMRDRINVMEYFKPGE